jgi:hypothetical protein
MILGRAIEGDEAARVMRSVQGMPDALKPVNPGLYHLAVQALCVSGLENDGVKLLRRYWGGMIERGATTFWEIYDSERPFLSPYGNYLVNSCCHTWSCSPAYFLRKLAASRDWEECL